MVTTAKVTKSPTGTAAIAQNIRAVRATNEWLLRYRPSLVFSNRATCKRSGFIAAARQTISWCTQISENIKDFDKWRCEVLGYPGVIFKVFHQGRPSFLQLLKVSPTLTAAALHLHTGLKWLRRRKNIHSQSGCLNPNTSYLKVTPTAQHILSSGPVTIKTSSETKSGIKLTTVVNFCCRSLDESNFHYTLFKTYNTSSAVRYKP